MPDFFDGLIVGIVSSLISLVIGKLTESLGTLGIIVFIIVNAFSVYRFIEAVSDMDMDFWYISYTLGWFASTFVIVVMDVLSPWEVLLNAILVIFLIIRKVIHKFE